MQNDCQFSEINFLFNNCNIYIVSQIYSSYYDVLVGMTTLSRCQVSDCTLR